MGIIIVLACQTRHLIPGHEPALGIKSEASSIHRTQTHELHLFFFLYLHTLSFFFLGEWEEKERDEEDNLGQSIVQVPRYPQGLPSCPALSSSFHLPPPPTPSFSYLSVTWGFMAPWAMNVHVSLPCCIISLFLFFSLSLLSHTLSLLSLVFHSSLSLCSFQLLG